MAALVLTMGPAKPKKGVSDALADAAFASWKKSKGGAAAEAKPAEDAEEEDVEVGHAAVKAHMGALRQALQSGDDDKAATVFMRAMRACAEAKDEPEEDDEGESMEDDDEDY